jgi:hypothetical protein
MVTRPLGRARADAMQCEQMKPSAALTTSPIVGHNTGTTTRRPYRYKRVTATRKFKITLSTDIHNARGISHTKSRGRDHMTKAALNTICR